MNIQPNGIKFLNKFDTRKVLKELVEEYSAANTPLNLENVLLVSMQHILETTIDMLSILKLCGLKDAIVGGKKYSTHPESAEKIESLGYTYVTDGYQLGYGHFDDCMQDVVHRIWAKALEKVTQKKYDLMIILDDGADLLRATPGQLFDGEEIIGLPNKPKMIVGVEQTRAGINHPLFNGLPFPIINVAGAFAKTKLEYPKVAGVVAEIVKGLVSNKITFDIQRLPVIGILGYGTMGQAVASHFSAIGFPVIIYDRKHAIKSQSKEVVQYDNSAVLISNADIIVGCSGEDLTSIPSNLSALLYSRQKKWLISTGSKDHEFNALLRIIQHEKKGFRQIPNPFENILYKNRVGSCLEIIRGGFPVNFKNTAHSVRPEYIWPTRAALLLACLSAKNFEKHFTKSFIKGTNTFMLSPLAQLLIIRKYLELNNNDEGSLPLKELSDREIYDLILKSSDGATLLHTCDFDKLAEKII